MLASVSERVLILGAGFGGLELATVLSEQLGDGVEVTLVDRNDSFVFGVAKLDVMFGHATPEAVRMPYAEIAKPGVRVLRETVTAIDPEARRVTTDAGTHEADVLVVALGADEAVNYRTIRLPSDMDVPTYVKDQFPDFYRAMFDHQVVKEDLQAVFTEYAWDVGWCDPCASEPLSAQELKSHKSEHSWDYIYEPDAPSVIDELLTRYIEALVYQAVAENMASEQSARMVAMKAATESAGDMIKSLSRQYNRARQAQITKEISEIIGGVEALK